MRATVLVGLAVLISVGPSWAGEAPIPISPDSYRALTCAQIVQEARAVSRKGFVLLGLQPGSGGTDLTETRSAVIFVWAASTIASAEKMVTLRYAESQIAALEQASVASQCSIQFKRPEKIAP
jgi:hypothetical protein